MNREFSETRWQPLSNLFPSRGPRDYPVPPHCLRPNTAVFSVPHCVAIIYTTPYNVHIVNGYAHSPATFQSFVYTCVRAGQIWKPLVTYPPEGFFDNRFRANKFAAFLCVIIFWFGVDGLWEFWCVYVVMFDYFFCCCLKILMSFDFVI